MKKVADVVIIGGGCIGASVAYHLVRRGVTDVVLVEREALLGMGSTGRNAGGVRHQFSSEANVKLSIESIRFLERFHDEVGYEIDFHQDGYLFLLSTGESLDAFRRGAAKQRRFGVEVDFVTPAEAEALAPGLNVEGVAGATFCKRDGIADPNGVTVGLAKAAQAAGIEVVRETEVTAIKLTLGRVSAVETNRGTISTGAVVNAAGPWARQIGAMVDLAIPVLPYRRHIFMTAPIEAVCTPGASASFPPTRIMVIDFETTLYFHREGAGILFGMSDRDEPSGFDTSVNWEFAEKVASVAVKRLPALGGARIASTWAGLYEVTPDAMPIIGAAPEVAGFYMINGFSGHGFQHSPAAGRRLAEIITTGDAQDTDVAPFAFDRFSRAQLEREENVV